MSEKIPGGGATAAVETADGGRVKKRRGRETETRPVGVWWSWLGPLFFMDRVGSNFVLSNIVFFFVGFDSVFFFVKKFLYVFVKVE